MASPSTDMLIHEDFFYLKLLLLLHTQHCSTQKSIRQDYSHQTNLTSSPEFDGRVGELGDKASWSVEDWAVWKTGHTWNSWHTTKSSKWTNIHYNSNVCRFCTSTERKSLPRPPLDWWERSVDTSSFAVSADVICCKYTRMYWHYGVKITTYK